VQPQNELMVVGRDLRARPFTSLAALERLEVFVPETPAPPTAAVPTAPLTGNGTLEPGTLYPSSTGEERLRFYLPAYALATIDGAYAVRLRRRTEQDPAGAAGYLTVELAAARPDSQGFELREVEHQLVGRLQYRVPVVSETAAAAMAMAMAAPGPVISDPDGPRAPNDPTLTIELGAFTPTGRGTRRCELPLAAEADVARVYQALTDPGAEARLALGYFATAAQRSWRQILLGEFVMSAKKLVADRGVQMAPLVPVGEDTAPPVRIAPGRVSPPIDGRPARLPAALQRPELAPLARRPLFAVGDAIKPAAMLRLREDAPETTVSPRLAVPLRERTVGELSPKLMRRPPRDDIEIEPVADDPIPVPRGNAWKLKHILDESGVDVTVEGRPVKGLPVWAAVDESGEPAIVTFAVEVRADLPFTFPGEAYRHLFPNDLEPSRHVLVRSEVNEDGRPVAVYYRDPAFPGRCYYQPQAFRVPRIDRPPFLPDVRIAPLDLVVGGVNGSDEADVTFRALVNYRAVPYVERRIFAAMQDHATAAVGGPVELIALQPRATALSLRIPQDEAGGALTSVARTSATITFDDGIADQLELSKDELHGLVASLSGPGIDGTVSASLPGADALVPVHLSLHESAGEVLRARLQAFSQEGATFELHNPIESRVTIDEAFPVRLGSSAVALPDLALGTVVEPGGKATLAYAFEPAGAVTPALLATLEPVLDVSVQVDAAALLPKLLVEPGYSSDTFAVDVSIDTAYFASTPPGQEPLAGVRLEFRGAADAPLEAVATLTAAAPAQRVTLHMALAAWLANAPDAVQYEHRVVNLHGDLAQPRDGAAGEWVHVDGNGALAVVPAGA
jgi:hypothetical protein